MKEILRDLFDHKTLSRQEARRILTSIAKGEYNHSQIAAFLSVYLMRSITVEELGGFRDAMLELCIPVDFHDLNTIDLCGTGGDGKDTFNISTLASFVVAGAGAMVAKHGNYGVSSACGSSNIMETLGYKFSSDKDKLRKEIETCGICFFHAPLFNPAMKNVAPVRKDLGMKTFFNMLGPMVNPSSPANQLVGVFSLELARLYNYLYQETGKSFIILHSLDGYDEVSLTGDTRLISNSNDQILTPEQMGYSRVTPTQIKGGNTVAESVDIFKTVLEGKGDEARTNVVLANASLGIQCLYPEKSPLSCREMAKESLLSGKAKEALNKLIALQS